MKPHNNLSVILTFGVPTTVLLFGLFWLLKRKKGGDSDKKDQRKLTKPCTGDAPKEKRDASEANKALAVKPLHDRGDSLNRGEPRKRQTCEESINCRIELKKESQQVIDDHLRSVYHTDSTSKKETDSPPTSHLVTTLQSDQNQLVHASPAGEENVAEAESSVVTSLDIFQPSDGNRLANSLDPAAKSWESSELSLQSEWSLLSEVESQVKSNAKELTALSPTSGASATTQPSSNCSQSDSVNAPDAKATEENVASSGCFSQTQSSAVFSSFDSSALVGHSTDQIVADSNQALHSFDALSLSELTSFQSSESSTSEAANPEPEAPAEDDSASTCVRALPSEEAAVTAEEVCLSSTSSVCSLQKAESECVPSTIADKDCSRPTGSDISATSVNADATTTASASSTADVEDTSDTKGNISRSESKAPELQDTVETQGISSRKESNKSSSSSVVLSASSSNSSANSSALLTTEKDQTTSNKDKSKRVDSKDTPKTSTSKDSPKTSKTPKNVSSQSKSGPHSKSASPSKSKQSSSPGKHAAGSHSRGNKNQSSSSSPRDRSSDSISKTPAAVAENGRVDSSSPICDTNSEASNDSGRGGSVGDTLLPSGGDLVQFDFNFPSELCGRLIGRGGKNIQYIKDQSGAVLTLSSNPFTPEFQICHVRGLQADVDRALMMIRKKFPLAHYPRLDMTPLTPQPAATPLVLPEMMQLSLPEGVSIDVVVSAVVNAGHIFLQQPTHPAFPSLERLNQLMNACYTDITAPTPSLPRPVDVGIICVSESEGMWYRTQVVQVYPEEDECDIKYVDYGGYSRVPINSLKQIRSDFMTLPFQAVECYLANVTPLQGEDEYFSEKAAEVLMELTSGQMLQGQVVARGDDNIGYVHLYRVSGHKVLMINREMVNREVVRWIEIL